jgi:rhodanese-related sulfurtransferase
MRLPHIDWSAASRHAVILVDTQCPFSTQALEFYRRVIDLSAETRDTAVIVLSVEDEATVGKWLGAQTESVRLVRLSSPSQFGFFVTPTVLMVDSRGRATDLLAGRLQTEDKDRFLQRLRGEAIAYHLNNSPAAPEIERRHLAPFDNENAVLLDVSSRDSKRGPGAANVRWIPADELRSRALAELPRDRAILVECSGVPRGTCDAVGMSLRSRGFDRTFLLVDTSRQSNAAVARTQAPVP